MVEKTKNVEKDFIADENQRDCDGEVDYELQEARLREQDEDSRQEFYESWDADCCSMPCVQACDALTSGGDE